MEKDTKILSDQDREFNAVRRQNRRTLRDERLLAGCICLYDHVPGASALTEGPHGPIVTLAGPYWDADGNGRVPQGIRRVFSAPESGEVRVGLDALLLELADIFDDNPYNVERRFVHEVKRAHEERDLYIDTQTVLNELGQTADLIGDILYHDLTSGAKFFRKGFHDFLYDAARRYVNDQRDKLEVTKVQQSRKRIVRWAPTDEYAIRDQIRDELPMPDSQTFSNYIEVLVKRASQDREFLDQLVDACLFARLGIQVVDLSSDGIYVPDEQNSAARIIVRPSEDGRFMTSFDFELPQEVAQLYLQEVIADTITFVQREEERSGRSYVSIKTTNMEMSFPDLRRFLIESRKNGDHEFAGMTFSRRQGVAHLHRTRVGNMVVELPAPTAPKKAHTSHEVRATLCVGDVEIRQLEGDTAIALFQHTGNSLSVLHSQGNVQLTECKFASLNVASTDDGTIVLKGGSYDRIDLGNVPAINGTAVTAGRIHALDAYGKITVSTPLDPSVVNIAPDDSLVITVVEPETK